jgi:signal transduction histidine kinase
MESRLPRHNMAFLAMGAFNVGQYLLLVFHPSWNGPTMPVLNVALIATSISTAIHLGWRSREGLTFTLGLLPIFFSGSVAAALFSGLLAQNFQTQVLIIAPVVLAIILFAYGIGMQTGAQIRAARQRLEASEDSLIRMNDHLEQLVEKRTRHLREAQDQLVQAEKLASLGGLVAGVAHEINTPLGVGLTGASHALDRANELKRQVDTGAIKRSELTSALTDIVNAGEIVIKNLNRADHLVQSFKRIAADQTSERPETIDLGQYIQDVLRSLEPTIKRAQVDVQATLPDGLRLTTQPGAIAQVVTNLIQNAIIHAFEGVDQPQIKIAIGGNLPGKSDGTDLLTITVTDNGRGMSDDVRAKAFDPFFTTKRGAGGTGLGLHIVHNLVAGVLGGNLSLSSTLGQGTTFTIDLPRNYVRA